MALKDLVRHHSFESWHWFEFTCGHCGSPTSGPIVMTVVAGTKPAGGVSTIQYALTCSGCFGVNLCIGSNPKQPSERHPVVAIGRCVEGLPVDVEEAWQEARRALSAGAPVASEHMCRKILLHVAVEKGADPKSSFFDSVEYLFKQGHLPSQMRPWVDRIRLNGNVAAHQIQPRDDARARATLEFTQELLHLVYEMEHAMKQLASNTP